MEKLQLFKIINCNFLVALVINAWNKVDLNTVIKSFKKCGISNSMDGTGNCLLWEGTSDSDEHENCNIKKNKI